MGYQFQSVGSVGPALIEQFVIDLTMLGTLIGLYKIPGIFLALPSGLAGRRFGLVRVATLGVALMVVGGIATAIADSYAFHSQGRLVSGVGAVIFNVLSVAIIANRFEARELPLAMAFYTTTWPLGIALGLSSQPVLAEALSMQGMMWVTAALCSCGFIALALISLFSPPEATDRSRPFTSGSGINKRSFLLLSIAAVVWLKFNAGLIVVVSFAPTFLVSNGITSSEAGLISSVGSWLGIISIPLAGYAIQKWGHANLTITVLLIGGGLVSFLIAWTDAWLIMFCLFSIIAWAPAGPIVALPVAFLTTENRALGMGIFLSYYYLGIGFLL